MDFVRVTRYGRLSAAFLAHCLKRLEGSGSEDPP